MKEYTGNTLNNFIAGWYIAPDLCKTVVDKSENNVEKFESWSHWYQHCDLKEFDKELCAEYESSLYQVIELYKQQYPLCYQKLQRWGWTPPRIQRYNPGQYYDLPHCENGGASGELYRHMAYMTYLNDIVDGGGTEFLNQQLTTPAETGLTLIWPAQWTHYHKGVVAPSDVKYIITGWLCFHH